MLTLESTVRLNSGYTMPRLGLGVFQAGPGRGTRRAVEAALEAGYRHIDTASMYGNEREVGAAIRASGIAREEVFVTTKLWNDDQGYDEALRAFDRSAGALDLGYVDLYLIHWPVEGRRGESWKALTRLSEEGRVRSVGVSNFMTRHIDELQQVSPLRPAANQVELHPFLAHRELRRDCAERSIVVQAYSPLTKGIRLDDPVLNEIGTSHHKSPAQIMIRWCLEKDLVVLPKSSNPERIRENADVYDFELSVDDLARLDALDEGWHCTWDPTRAP